MMIRLARITGVSLVLAALASCGGSGSDLPAFAIASSPCAALLDSSAIAGSSKGSPVLAADTVALGKVWVPLSSCTFDANRNVTIGGDGGCGPYVTFDQSFTQANNNALGKVTIAAGGILAVPTGLGGTREIETAGFLVDGTLSMGTDVCPVGGASDPQGRVKVTFTGSQIPSNPMTDSGSDKGIEVRKGGSLRLHGAKGVVGTGGVSWTQLSQPAGPAEYRGNNILAPVPENGERVLHLAADVRKGQNGGWKQGDWIVVATTSFSPFESEFVQIKEVLPDGTGSMVTLEQRLRHYHFGSADPGLPSDANYGADASTNFGVDERAEVGLISRNVTFTSRVAEPTNGRPQDLHWGGEIRILEGFAEASIQGVELEKFGKARLGSYPIHFHMTGDASGVIKDGVTLKEHPRHLVDSNSIHHSYNKCVTVHMSQGVSITNDVCARAVGHLFYQEIAQEQKGSFIGNLGIGAMSHNFGIDEGAVQKVKDDADNDIVKNWWEGDNLAKINGYDGFNVPNMDKRDNPMHGNCFSPNGSGGLMVVGKKSEDGKTDLARCDANPLYVEPASGFWIGNPSTTLEGNSIGGCQGTGKAYWFVPPATGQGPQFEKFGSFVNNRAHSCFDGVFGEEEDPVASGQMFPTTDGTPGGQNLIAHFKGLTATRMRNRGFWVRPMWNVVETGRFATNRDSVTLVSSGGPDGNGPGVWSMVKDSVFVGLSTNNVDRWGPCPPTSGDGKGCVDANPKANDLMDKGYPSPRWNMAGYMIYDGPVRIIHNHFVNFRKDITSLLTSDDRVALSKFVWSPPIVWSVPAGQPLTAPMVQTTLSDPTRYEGDAALGWFQSNQSAYPTATVTKALSFDNVDLRHQIYTERVNVNTFRDGDKNTAVIDLDGTLTGYQIVDKDGNKVPDEYPISLNNLPFNRTGNSVDECLATGQQDEDMEGRATSLISPANMASLEFEVLPPPLPGSTVPAAQLWQDMVFQKDSPDGAERQSMRLQSRNGLWVWEPKVASGTGYTVRAAKSSDAGQQGTQPLGMPGTVRVGLTDAVKSHMDTKPFFVRVGICYSNKSGSLLNGDFKITRGYKSWGGNGAAYDDPLVRTSFNRLADLYKQQHCINLDQQNPTNNFRPVGSVQGEGCPAEGVILRPPGGCGFLREDTDNRNQAVCIYPRRTLSKASSMAEITNSDGTPTAAWLDKYYFDSGTGMLFFYVVQDSPNAKGVAPVGSCKGDASDDPSCPRADELETYFPCPAQGCINYSVVVNDPGYVPGPSACDVSGFTLPEPVITNYLGYVGERSLVQANPATSSKGFTHWLPAREPSCQVKTLPIAKPVADAGAKRDLPTVQLARWLREGVERGTAWATDSSKAWFSARRSPVREIEAQICSATAS